MYRRKTEILRLIARCIMEQLPEKQRELLELYHKANEENKAKIFLKVISLYNKQYGIESDFELLTD